MFTGRYGTGLVVSRLPDDSWSAPSAVQITGMGWGLQLGAEVTSVMLILTNEGAVDTFKSRAQISVGAELGVSVGPFGRSFEGDVTAGSKVRPKRVKIHLRFFIFRVNGNALVSFNQLAHQYRF
jgi:lipid-binding SYLF domain-containing protein